MDSTVSSTFAKSGSTAQNRNQALD